MERVRRSSGHCVGSGQSGEDSLGSRTRRGNGNILDWGTTPCTRAEYAFCVIARFCPNYVLTRLGIGGVDLESVNIDIIICCNLEDVTG